MEGAEAKPGAVVEEIKQLLLLWQLKAECTET